MATGVLARTVHRHAGDVAANCRITIYPDGTVGDVLACSLAQFVPPGWEREDKVTRASCGSSSTDGESIARARRRARKRVRDLIRCNGDLDVFFTLTLAPSWLYGGHAQSRTDYTMVNRKAQQWFADRVRRRGLRYVAVYEYHHRLEHDGRHAIHIHGVCNHDALHMVDSGHKYRDRDGHWHRIYNISDWTLGITTAMYLYGDRARATEYICKYIYKSERPVGGRWYMHSHNLAEPQYMYLNIDYESAPGTSIYIPDAHCAYKHVPINALPSLIDNTLSSRSPASAGAGGVA